MVEEVCSLKEARKKVLACVRAQSYEVIEISQACGLVIAEEIRAPKDIPPCEISLRDGYAVSAGDLSGGGSTKALRLTGAITTGDKTDISLTPGSAIKITTGAPLPGLADSVIPYEDVEVRGDLVFPMKPVIKGQYVLRPGSLATRETIVARRGDILVPTTIASIVDTGKAFLKVIKKPRVGILVTGDEVVEPDYHSEDMSVFCSNRYLLSALVKNYGGESIALGIAPDDEEILASILEMEHLCDCIVISGGTGKGEHDCVKNAWRRLGIEIIFDGVLMHPAKGTAFGYKDGVLFFSLPGNPLASGISFVQLVSVALLKISNKEFESPPELVATLAQSLPAGKDGTPRFFWGRAVFQESELTVWPLGLEKTDVLSQISKANCIINVEVGAKNLPQGSCVAVHPVCLSSNLGYLTLFGQ